jgi:hypothetical protein
MYAIHDIKHFQMVAQKLKEIIKACWLLSKFTAPDFSGAVFFTHIFKEYKAKMAESIEKDLI